MPQARADDISPVRNQALRTNGGQLLISTRFHTQLPETLQQALLNGVPITFDLSWRLTEPSLTAYRYRISHLFNRSDTIQYRLSYHPITRRYRVSIGTFSTEYINLDAALKAVGAAANWRVLAEEALSDVALSDIEAQTRLKLSTAQLPKPFQINVLSSGDWQLDSGWHNLSIEEEVN